MKAKEFLKALSKASENAEVKVENGEIVIAEPDAIEYKFKVGDKVVITAPNSYPQDAIYEIVELKERNGESLYRIEYNGAFYRAYERYLKLAPQDITDRIKTFEDAVKWCKENKPYLYLNWKDYFDLGEGDEDIVAYLKLRIIACALNEGWEPKFEEEEMRFYPYSYIDTNNLGVGVDYETGAISFPLKLCFKSEGLAEYAAKQFSDIYAGFCGCEKGGEK